MEEDKREENRVTGDNQDATFRLSDFAAFIDLLSEPVLVVQADSLSAMVNESFSREFNIPDRVLSGETLTKCFVRLGISPESVSQGTKFVVDIPSADKDEGRTEGKTLSCIPLSAPDGTTAGALLIVKASCSAEECEDLRNRILESRRICHDLNQPVQVILGYSEMVLRSLDEEDKVYRNVSVIKTQVDKISACTRLLRATLRNESTSDCVIPGPQSES